MTDQTSFSMDVIKIEAFDILDKVYEINTTHKSYEEVANTIEDIMDGIYEDPKIDWLNKYEYLLFD